MTWLAGDRERLARFRQGDRTVLAEVYRRYAGKLARSVNQALGISSAFELDDLLQETFVKAFSPDARASYDGVRPFSAWLGTIARNVHVDRRRHDALQPQERALPELPPPEERPGAAPMPTPEALALERELAALWTGFLEGLEERERALVQLRFEEQSTRREVSERTGLSAMQVRLREARLRRALWELLERHGYGEAP